MSEGAPEFESIRCRMCGGPAHPASGCVYSPTFVVCGPCTREAWAWVVRHTNGKGGRKGLYFYAHALPLAAR